MAKWLEQASQWHEKSYYDLEVRVWTLVGWNVWWVVLLSKSHLIQNIKICCCLSTKMHCMEAFGTICTSTTCKDPHCMNIWLPSTGHRGETIMCSVAHFGRAEDQRSEGLGFNSPLDQCLEPLASSLNPTHTGPLHNNHNWLCQSIHSFRCS